MRHVISLLLLALATAFTLQSDFLAQQKKYERVRTAFEQKGAKITESLKELGIKPEEVNILITAFKDEGELVIYAKKKAETTYRKLAEYNICARSGELGPKRMQGDRQVPEGFYHIDRFNPASSFYLSLGINYPNLSDKRKTKAANPGGDIFIHGSCVTIGCLPMTDSRIKEIYLYAIHAKANGQNKIPVYIFPFRMDEETFAEFKEKYKDEPELTAFWTNIKVGYDTFEKGKKEVRFTVSNTGDYIF